MARAGPLYSANQRAYGYLSSDVIGSVCTYQVEYLWHPTVYARQQGRRLTGRLEVKKTKNSKSVSPVENIFR